MFIYYNGEIILVKTILYKIQFQLTHSIISIPETLICNQVLILGVRFLVSCNIVTTKAYLISENVINSADLSDQVKVIALRAADT